MFIDSFYTAAEKEAIPFILLNQNECDRIKSSEQACFAAQQFTGKCGDICPIHDAEGKLKTIYIGSGEGNQSSAIAAAVLKLPQGIYFTSQKLSQEAQLMWALAQYRFTPYKKQELIFRTLVTTSEDIKNLKATVRSIFLVRDLINTPTNDLGPAELSTVLQELASEHGAVFQQWVGEELLQHHLNAIHTVGRASEHEPRLLNLTWGNSKHPSVTLIGKGVCFDSGGLDIKPSSAMRLMKKDMGGAAHAIGLAQWIMARKLPVFLRVFIPAVENAIGPKAFRPGDIIRMYNGLTVEVDNTDAEGRLILADALAKACEEKPEVLIDFATLTGSARVALGTDIAALFCNNDTMAADLMSASQAVDDPMWRLPLFKGYESTLDSPIADLVNACDSPLGGAISAALFLQRFVDKTCSWAHFDIMAWNLVTKPGKPAGGEAIALRAVMHYLLKRFG